MRVTKVTRHQTKIVRYEGGNERIDVLLKEHWPEDEFYFVNGSRGRFPVWATSEDEAFANYVEKFTDEEEEDD